MSLYVQVSSSFGTVFQFYKSSGKQTLLLRLLQGVFYDGCSGQNVTQTNTLVEMCK